MAGKYPSYPEGRTIHYTANQIGDKVSKIMELLITNLILFDSSSGSNSPCRFIF